MKEGILENLEKKVVAPAYIFDLDVLNERMQMMHEIFDGTADLCFAMKANPLLTEPMVSLVSKFEVCSPGEFRICQRAQIPMEKIVLSGVNKTEADVAEAIQYGEGLGTFTVESVSQWQILQKVAQKYNKKINVLLRLSSGNQFGSDKDTVRMMVEKRQEYPNLYVKGIQLYSGTQKKKKEKIADEIHFLDEFLRELQSDFGYAAEELEYGPGFFVSYFEGETKIDDRELMEFFYTVLRAMNYKGHITLEMGRYMTASCGSFVTRVVDRKVNGEQRYLIIDGGIHHINYYGQSMGMKIPNISHLPKTEAAETMEAEHWCICGSLCTVGDVVVRNLPLHNPQIGDMLVFENAGAYSVTEGMFLFLSRDLPGVYYYDLVNGIIQMRAVQHTDSINDINRKNLV